ncbi:S66 family peptidase [Ktedonobacter racemifer]|uniref:Peptidase U61 LD-carboxypeptidase A n=1 Tax=Ktedonobacter racemifer DSM 44963 TaxID=485913 RepID=D6U4J2_KTERA|nr:S66 peptidase family protein [Ktedonobacter racemifer]EFH81422.1 peptidase U61 LD-carboxypeptidase A [Ktedonobacter racemifer DSM 44963]
MQNKQFIYPVKLQPGDKVAILSPSAGLPEIFPEVFDLGLQRLRENFGLIPVEYSCTRKMNTSPEARARDIMAAFADPEIKAVICSIGGDDQIKVLKHLDPEVLRAHPKPFLGYSDATNLHMYLWNLGIVSFYGGAIMTQFGRYYAMDEYTVESLRHALFQDGEFEIMPASEWSDENYNWGEPEKLRLRVPMFSNPGWKWHNAGSIIEGTAWGGCLEIVDYHLRAHRYLQPLERYKDCVLFLETSEEMPSAEYVYRVLIGMGERGLLQQFSALLMGRPKTWNFDRQLSTEQKYTYNREQEEAILKALQEYHPSMPVIFNMDFGHTDPQFMVPSGGYVRIDGIEKRVFVRY